MLKDLCSDQPAADIEKEPQEKLKALFDTRVSGAGQTVAIAEAVTKQLNDALPMQEATVKAAVDAAFGTVSKLEHDVELWFDTVMNRFSDIFTRKTRVITVVIFALIVIALQIDSGEILRQIVHSPELQAKLTAMSDSALSQADKLFDNSERASAALADIKKNHSNQPDDTQIVAALERVPPHLTRCVDAKNSLVEATRNLPGAEAILDEFDSACQAKTRQAMGNAYDEIRGLRGDLEKTDLKIIPTEIAIRIPPTAFPANWGLEKISFEEFVPSSATPQQRPLSAVIQSILNLFFRADPLWVRNIQRWNG